MASSDSMKDPLPTVYRRPSPPRFGRLLRWTAFFAVLSSPVFAQLPNDLIKENYDPTGKVKTSLRVTPLLDQVPPSGYFPVRISINNDGKIARKWTFRFTSTDSDYTDSGNEMRSDFSREVGSKESARFDILVPLVTAFQSGHSTSTTLKLDVSATALPGSSNTLTTYYAHAWPAIMVSQDLYTRNSGTLTSAATSALSSSSGPVHYPHGGWSSGGTVGYGIEFGAAFNPAEMSDDWRAYSGYDHCLLTEKDWNKLSPGAQNALLRWNRLGGSIVVYSDRSSTDLATLKVDSNARGVRKTTRSWGSFRIQHIDSALSLDAADTVDLVYRTIPKTTGNNQLASLHEDFRSHWPLQIDFGTKASGIAFFILVLIAFGILVGPVNLFVFARAGQRHKLFVTTPAISLAASLLLVVLILFQDGFGGRGQRIALMEIGPDNTAYICQEQITRTGVLLRTGFTSSEPGYFSPVMIGESRWARITESNAGGGSRYTIKTRENGIEGSGDWFQSRSDHGHLFQTIRPTRGRVELVGMANPPVIASTFEFPLDVLFYRDPNGGLWTASDIRQGAKTKLSPATEPQFRAWIDSTKKRFSGRNAQRLTMTEKRPGHFHASTTGAPGIDTLKSINWKSTETILSGIVTQP